MLITLTIGNKNKCFNLFLNGQMMLIGVQLKKELENVSKHVANQIKNLQPRASVRVPFLIIRRLSVFDTVILMDEQKF